MPRKPRLYLPGVPSHVIQRGNNRCACFFTDDDYRYYLQYLDEARQKYNVAVHAYVLMTNHVHLLMTPADPMGISRLMQSIGRRYVQYINMTRERSGTLWESRHKSSLVHADEYLLNCYCYIEMNPVRARIVDHPIDYPWSSYRYHACGDLNRIVEDHVLYRQLAREDKQRLARYRELFFTDMEQDLLDLIRKSANRSMPLGNDRFRAEIERTAGMKFGHDKRGRPPGRANAAI
jgi:putative transposase